MMRCPYCFESGEDKICRRCGRETEEMTDELKPCPFCGLKPNLNEAVTYQNGEKSSAFVRCPHCGLAYSFGDKNEQAVSRWNTRPIEDALRAENERLRAALAWYADISNYSKHGVPGRIVSKPCGNPKWGLTELVRDYGEKAREAMKGSK